MVHLRNRVPAAAREAALTARLKAAIAVRAIQATAAVVARRTPVARTDRTALRPVVRATATALAAQVLKAAREQERAAARPTRIVNDIRASLSTMPALANRGGLFNACGTKQWRGFGGVAHLEHVRRTRGSGGTAAKLALVLRRRISCPQSSVGTIGRHPLPAESLRFSRFRMSAPPCVAGFLFGIVAGRRP